VGCFHLCFNDVVIRKPSISLPTHSHNVYLLEKLEKVLGGGNRVGGLKSPFINQIQGNNFQV
jgi:hypothetical protein